MIRLSPRLLTLVIGDGDLVLASGRLLGGGHVEDTVGVNVEGHLDLGHATGCGGDAGQLELAEEVVVLGHGTFSLVDLEVKATLHLHTVH